MIESHSIQVCAWPWVTLCSSVCQIVEVKSPTKQSKQDKSMECDKVYLDELVELHKRLMTLREGHILQQIVNLIEETGHFHITNTTFDFDLCSLDRSTVRKLQSYLGTSWGTQQLVAGSEPLTRPESVPAVVGVSKPHSGSSLLLRPPWTKSSPCCRNRGYEIRTSAGNNLKTWYEGLVGGSDSAAKTCRRSR